MIPVPVAAGRNISAVVDNNSFGFRVLGKGGFMRTITYPYAKQHFESVMDELMDIHEPVRIEQQEGRSIVLVDAEDFDSLMETAYLLRSPANAARLKQALDEFESGKGIPLDAQAIVDAGSLE